MRVPPNRHGKETTVSELYGVVWKHNTDKRGLGHPAIFPEQLASDHITDAIAIGKYHAGILKLKEMGA